MKTAYFFSCFPQLSTTFLQREVRAVQALGLNPLLIANRPPKPTGFHPDDIDLFKATYYLNPIHPWCYLKANLKVFFKWPNRYKKGIKLAFSLKDKNFPKIRLINIARLAGAAVLADYLIKREIDHVHVHFAFGAAGLAIFLKVLSNISYSLSIHGSDVLLPRPLTGEKLSRARFIVSNCQFHVHNLKRRFSFLDNKQFYVTRLGINMHTGLWKRVIPCQTDLRLRILNVARLEPVKNHCVLIRACALLKEKNVNFHCRIVGDGSMQSDLEELVEKFNLTDSIEFMGPKYEQEVAALFEWAHVFVLSSLSEGTPMTVIEAMAKARPVIVPDITALPEMIVSGQTGYLFTKDSYKELADRLTELAQHSDFAEKLNQLGYYGRAHAERLFDIRRNSKQLLNIFRKEKLTSDFKDRIQMITNKSNITKFKMPKNNNTRLSVAIVTFNRSQLLRNSLFRIKQQTHLPDEVIVIDNASTDNTRKIAEYFMEFLPVKYVYWQERGVNAARNCAITNCTGDILVFTDDDAEAEPNWLQEICIMFQKHPDATAVVGVKENLFPENFTASLIQFTKRDLSMARDRDGEIVISPTLVDTCNLAVKTAVICEKGLLFNTTYLKGGDRDFGHQMFELGLKVVFCEKAIVRHYWPKSIISYFRLRYSSGIVKALLQQRADNAGLSLSTKRWSPARIALFAWDRASSFSVIHRIAFLLLIVLGQIVNKIAYLNEKRNL